MVSNSVVFMIPYLAVRRTPTCDRQTDSEYCISCYPRCHIDARIHTVYNLEFHVNQLLIMKTFHWLGLWHPCALFLSCRIQILFR